MSTKVKSFKRAGEMQDGINHLVRSFMTLARDAHKEVKQCKRDGYLDSYHRARARRSSFIWSARQLLLATTNGVLTTTCADRRSKRFWENLEAKKAAEQAKSAEVVG